MAIREDILSAVFEAERVGIRRGLGLDRSLHADDCRHDFIECVRRSVHGRLNRFRRARRACDQACGGSRRDRRIRQAKTCSRTQQLGRDLGTLGIRPAKQTLP